MKFVSVRELRSRSAEVLRQLSEVPDVVVTSNGKPVAILSAVSSAGLEESLSSLRRARAIAAVEAMQSQSLAAGKHRLDRAAIQGEIDAVRKGRGK